MEFIITSSLAKKQFSNNFPLEQLKKVTLEAILLTLIMIHILRSTLSNRVLEGT